MTAATARIGAGCRDMSLHEALADPLIRAMMAADRVDPARLAAELAHVSAKWSPVRRQKHAQTNDPGSCPDSEGKGRDPGETARRLARNS
jgi:hypothetical protein